MRASVERSLTEAAGKASARVIYHFTCLNFHCIVIDFQGESSSKMISSSWCLLHHLLVNDKTECQLMSFSRQSRSSLAVVVLVHG